MTRATLVALIALGIAPGARAEPIEISGRVLAHVRQIDDRNPDLRNDVFSKMGGSSVASRAFLRCFASPYVDLGEHQDLASSIEYFHGAHGDSFGRESDAAGVSWNLRYVLRGRPPHFRREIERTQARWALVLFGGNDAQNQNERVYAERLVFLVEQLEEMGVVPILGSALPRRSESKDLWIRRFNAITEAVARHWELPFIDYYEALRRLPRSGLARDGVHPNVYGQGGLRSACQLTETGLRYGNNMRNLLTLQMLDALRISVLAAGTGTHTDTAPDAAAAIDPATPIAAAIDPATPTAAATDPATPTDAAAATAADPVTDPVRDPAPFPLSALVDKPSLPPLLSLPRGCGSSKPGSRLYRTRLELLERTRLRASAFDLSGDKPRVFWARADEKGERCVRRRDQTIEVDARPGMWDFIVEVPERAAQEGRMLILITRDSR